MFRFTSNEKLKEAWIRAIPRVDSQQPTDYSRFRSLHFCYSDFVESTVDTRNRQRNKRASAVLIRKRLKKDAVSTRITHPSYFNLEKPVSRSTEHALPDKSRQMDEERMQHDNQDFMHRDKINSIPDLMVKLNDAILPAGFITVS
jgi:hypothetical protein